MCELFALSSAKKVYLNDYLKTFMSHSRIHPHGWGLALFHGNDVNIEKEPKPAYQSDYVTARLESPIEVCHAIAHIRYASRGNLVYRNCHPFTAKDGSGRNWTLAHNGTIFQSEILDAFEEVQLGSSDSERILCYLIKKMNLAMGLSSAVCLDNYPYGSFTSMEFSADPSADTSANTSMNKLQPLSPKERFQIMDQLILETAEHNKTNLLIFDGELLYVHTNMKGTLYYKEEADYVMFSTVPLDEGLDESELKELWKPVPMMQLMAFRAGKLAFTGTRHEYEYVKVDVTMTGAAQN